MVPRQPGPFTRIEATLGLNTRKCLSCKGSWCLRRPQNPKQEGTPQVKRTQWRPWLPVVAGGESLIYSAGGLLVTQTARVWGLDQALSAGLRRWRHARASHDPAKILLDLAVMVALGGDCAADIAVLRAQPGVFGPVDSDPTVSRTIDHLASAGSDASTAIRTARAAARAWVLRHAGAPT